MMAPTATTRAPREVARAAVSRVERPVVTTSSTITTRSPWRRVKPRRSPISSPLRSLKRKGTPRPAATSWPMMTPPSAGDSTESGWNCRSSSARSCPTWRARTGSSSSRAHCTYAEEWRPEESRKCPRRRAPLSSSICIRIRSSRLTNRLLPVNVVLVELLVEIAARRVDRLRRLGDVPVVLLQLVEKEHAFRQVAELAQGADRQQGGRELGTGAAGGRDHVLAGDLVARREDQHALDQVLELADVPLPGQRLEVGHGLGGELLGLVVVLVG